MTSRIVLFFAVFIWASHLLPAQSPLLDSLQQALNQTQNEEQRLQLLIEISTTYNAVQPNLGLPFAHDAVQLAQQLNLAEKQARAEVQWGRLHANSNQLDSALYHFQKAKIISKRFDSPHLRWSFVISSFTSTSIALIMIVPCIFACRDLAWQKRKEIL